MEKRNLTRSKKQDVNKRGKVIWKGGGRDHAGEAHIGRKGESETGSAWRERLEKYERGGKTRPEQKRREGGGEIKKGGIERREGWSKCGKRERERGSVKGDREAGRSRKERTPPPPIEADAKETKTVRKEYRKAE